jgi:cytochrome d ubiquinol oxidase subunit II
LNVENASSSQYTLGVMTWVAVVMIPLVLTYQSWTYWVFRKRIRRESIPAHAH